MPPSYSRVNRWRTVEAAGVWCFPQGFPTRVVAVSSTGHRFQSKPFEWDDLHFNNRKYTRYGAYGQSKAANILFAKELATRCAGFASAVLQHMQVLYSLFELSLAASLAQH